MIETEQIPGKLKIRERCCNIKEVTHTHPSSLLVDNSFKHSLFEKFKLSSLFSRLIFVIN